MLNLFCCFFSGLLTALSGSSEKTAFLVFFAPALFFFSCKTAPKNCLKYAFVYGFALWGGSCLWLFELYKNGFLPSLFLTFSALFAISILGGLIFSVSFLLFFFAVKYRFPFLFSFAFSYLLAEFLPSVIGPFSFPWTSLASSASCYPPFLQIAAFGGSLSVSLIIIIINGLIAHAFSSVSDHKKSASMIACALFVFALNVSFGYLKMSVPKESEKLMVAVVQGNLGAGGKWTTDKNDTLFLYSELSRLIAKNDSPDLIVLPETSYPWTDSAQLSSFSSLSQKLDTCVVFGFFEAEADRMYNAARVTFPSGELSDVYRKRRLVPFGEYDPFGFLGIELVGDLSFGKRGGVVETPVCNIGFLICFESLFPDLNRQNISDGADLTVIMTNDSWFGSSSALYRHRSHAILRAVESGRSVICAANTGMSCVISKEGVITASAPANTTAAFYAETEKITDGTLYSSVGDVIILAALILLLQFEFFLESVYTSACID